MILNVCGGMPSEIANIVSKVITIIQIVVPVGLVIFGMLDFAKATWAQKDEEIAKGRNTFFKRLINGALVFFVIAIVRLVFSVIDTNGSGETISCLNAILNGTGGTSYDGGGIGGSGGGSSDKTTTTKPTTKPTTTKKTCKEADMKQYYNCIQHSDKATCFTNYSYCGSIINDGYDKNCEKQGMYEPIGRDQIAKKCAIKTYCKASYRDESDPLYQACKQDAERALKGDTTSTKICRFPLSLYYDYDKDPGYVDLSLIPDCGVEEEAKYLLTDMNCEIWEGEIQYCEVEAKLIYGVEPGKIQEHYNNCVAVYNRCIEKLNK